MKEFIFLIRTDPDSLNPELIAQLDKSWQPLISGWMEKELLVNSLIFRGPGLVLSAGNRENQTYVRELGNALTGCLVLKAGSLNEAAALGRSFPTLSIGGSVEIRELQKLNDEKTVLMK